MHPFDNNKVWFQGKGHWQSTPDEDWNNWKWQMKNRLFRQEQIEKYIELTEEEKLGFSIAKNKLSVAITPHFFNLIDPNDSCCPIRRQVIPSNREGEVSSMEFDDPVGEEKTMPVPCIVHRYPDRILFLATDRCAAYCRYCTRSRMVSNAQGYGFHPTFEKGIEYIRENTRIRDVLISGGDPLLMSDSKIDYILSILSTIEHLEIIRIGSRIPIFCPQRITPSLLTILSKVPNLWMSIHTNHPSECTQELRFACHELSNTGIPLGNQSVLLKGINDSANVIKSLLHRLLIMKVRPYYLYQCDLVKGSSHFRTDPRVGLSIIEELRGHTSGYAIPQFVIDAPGGGGKIPINPDSYQIEGDDSLILRNYEGKRFVYPLNTDGARTISITSKGKKDLSRYGLA